MWTQQCQACLRGPRAKHTGQGFPGPRPGSLPACVAPVSPSLQWAPDGWRSWAPGILHPSPAHPGPAACCRPEGWTQTPLAGENEQARCSSDSWLLRRAPSAGTLAAGKSKKGQPGPSKLPTPTAFLHCDRAPAPRESSGGGEGAFLRSPAASAGLNLAALCKSHWPDTASPADMGDQ